MSTYTVLACPAMQGLADRIVADAGVGTEVGRVSWGNFPDGFPNLKLEDSKRLKGQNVIFLASFHSPEEIFRQLAVLYALPAYGVRSLTVVLPFFPTGTMDRDEVGGEIVTSKTLARMLSVIPACMERKTEIIIVDIHALQEWHYFGDGVCINLLSAIPLLKEQLGGSNVSIAFPDDGARKRFGHQFPEWPHIVCDKIRSGTGRKVTIKEGDPRGKRVVIVDDLAQTAGTIHACKDALLSADAENVDVFVTHGVFPQNSWEKCIDAGFGTVWITDSCPLTASVVADHKPFKVLSLSRLITTNILL